MNLLEVEYKSIAQVMTFNYLGTEITSEKNLIVEVAGQANQASKMSGWKNKYVTTKSKRKIAVRPVLTYAAGSKADTKKNKKKINNVDMKVHIKIAQRPNVTRQTNSIRDNATTRISTSG